MLVDPLAEHVETYLQELGRRGLKLTFVVDTHVHADHLSGSALLKERTGARYLMHRNSVAGCIDRHLDDGDTLTLGDVPVTVLATPGHTQDSISLLLPGKLLTGDFLFIGEGGAGRTDLPGGDAGEHWEALGKLTGLPDTLEVYPGHDYHHRESSTLGEERRGNPRLRISERSKYVKWLESQDLGPAEWMKDVIAANYACRTDARGLPIPDEKPACEVSGTAGDAVQQLVSLIPVAELAQRRAAGGGLLVLDVREGDEFVGELGHIPGARRISLNELGHRVHELAAWRHQPLVTVCKAGGRSRAAAAVLVAEGFTQVRSLDGGMHAWRAEGLTVSHANE